MVDNLLDSAKVKFEFSIPKIINTKNLGCLTEVYLKNFLDQNKGILVGVVIVLLIFIGYLSTTTIGPGERGVLMDFGAVQPGVMQPGFHFIVPFMQSVIHMNVRVQKYKEAERAASKDLQEVKTTVAVDWHINSKDANWIYQHLGTESNVEINIISPTVANAVKAITADYNAKDLIVERDRVRNATENMVRRDLKQYHIMVDSLNITNFQFSSQFSAAIERKQVAQQQALQARYELQRAEVEAKQKIVTATAEAKAMKLKEVSVTPGLIQWEAVQKWNGTLPSIVGGHIPFIVNMPSVKSVK